MTSTVAKLCGMTRFEDIRLAFQSGATYFGIVVEVPWSKRSCSVRSTAEIFKQTRKLDFPGAALFCDADEDFILSAQALIRPFAVQLQGRETPEFVARLKQRVSCQVWKAVHLSPKGGEKIDVDTLRNKCLQYTEAGADVLILDTMVKSSDGTKFGGTGQVSDWDTAAQLVEKLESKVFLAGGLKPENITEAIEKVRPNGIDLASGIESSPGIKDPEKIRFLMERVRYGGKA